jgi:monofunctional biosynthetic peptidoglycan transglycosylase
VRGGAALRVIGKGLIGAAAVVFAIASYVWVTLPDVRPLVKQNPSTTAFMRLRADEARALGKTPRVVQRWVSYRRVSPLLVSAVRLAEDAAFVQHDGVESAEPRAADEASLDDGKPMRGASTITQQLAKNLYLSPSRNPTRKLAELFITRRLEAELSKGRILELYLNLIEWGDGIWGAEAAAQVYFGVSAADLSEDQAALLAGAIINPRIYSPAHPNTRLLRRQQIILQRMRRTGASVGGTR